MKKSHIAALLSIFIFPGAGQIYNREPLKGIACIILTIVSLIGLVSLIIVSFLRAAEDFGGYGSIWVLWGRELARVGDGIIICLLGLFCIWIISIIDAYIRVRRKK